MPDTDSALEFPCRFPIKAMGRNEPGFTEFVVDAVREHAGPLGDGDIHSRPSRGGRYLSVTVTFNAVSREQVDSIYRRLSATDQVLFLL
jgi:uncharacterized protein